MVEQCYYGRSQSLVHQNPESITSLKVEFTISSHKYKLIQVMTCVMISFPLYECLIFLFTLGAGQNLIQSSSCIDGLLNALK